MYNNDLSVQLNTKNTIKKIIKFFFGKKILKKIIFLKLRMRLWIIFLFSIIKFKKKLFFIYNVEGWHLGDGYEIRKKKYTELLMRDLNCSIIHLDLHSHKMINFFLLVLKIKKFKFNSYKFLKKKRINNKNIDFTRYFKKCMWDISLRDKYFLNKNFIDLDQNSYAASFELFAKKKKISKKLLRAFINLLKIDALDGIIITQECYEEWAISLLALKYKLSVILFESRLGLIEYTSAENEDIHQKNSKFLFNLTKKIELDNFNDSKFILDNRTNGIYESSSMFYMSNIDKKNYEFKSIKKNAVFLFLHAFVDGPNIKSINKSSSGFIDYYHFSLWVLEFCAHNNIPLYVKPHPNRSDYISEIYFINSFKKALEQKKNLNNNFYYEFIDGNFKSKELKKFKNPIVFTGRGSVIIELAYLGIKSFTFFKNDYLNFKFTNYISNPIQIDHSELFTLDNQNLVDEKKNEAILVEAALNKIEKDRIFEFNTISQLTKKYNEPTKNLKDLINIL